MRKQSKYTQTGIERVQALADIWRSGYVVIATKPVHRLQIRPIVNNWGTSYHSSKLHPGPYSVWECGEGQTDT